MACRDHYAPFVSDYLAFRVAVECGRACVHRRCKHVSTQAQDEFADLVVCLGADVSEFFFEGLFGPYLYTPVLIVDEDASVFDGRGVAYVSL